MPTCPKGHDSSAGDYCDHCGTPIAGATATAVPDTGPSAQVQAADRCPDCGTPQSGRFCEIDGHDFLAASLGGTSSHPRSTAPVPQAASASDGPGSPAGAPTGGSAGEVVAGAVQGGSPQTSGAQGGGVQGGGVRSEATQSDAAQASSVQGGGMRSDGARGQAAPLGAASAVSDGAGDRPAGSISTEPDPAGDPATGPVSSGSVSTGAGPAGSAPPGPVAAGDRSAGPAPGRHPSGDSSRTGTGEVPAPVVDQSTVDGSGIPPALGVVVLADREYHARVLGFDGPDAGTLSFPEYAPRRRFALTDGQLLIGRYSRSRGIEPDIDLTGPPADPGVSHAHALFVPVEGGWAVVDLGSANGTFVNAANEPIEPHVPVPFAPGDTVHVGAWTTLRVG